MGVAKKNRDEKVEEVLPYPQIYLAYFTAETLRMQPEEPLTSDGRYSCSVPYGLFTLFKVQMISAVSGEPMLRRVKQETDATPQYSSPEPQPPHPQPLHPRQMPMMQSPEVC